MSNLLKDDMELMKQWNYEKNGDLKPTDLKSGANRIVWWKCDKGHEWEAKIITRASRHRKCPYCNK